MIFVALGANLPSPRHGTPLETCLAAVAALPGVGIEVVAQSRWYRSAPVPASSQPWYVNGVVRVATDLEPHAVLAALHGIERDFGRVRGARNAARVIDLDLIAHGREVIREEGGARVPHPRLHERAFVLLPLADLAPDWVHPETGWPLAEMIARLPADQATEPLDDGAERARAPGLP